MQQRLGCYHKNQTYQENAPVPHPDPCQSCYCHQGNLVCVEIQCPNISHNCIAPAVPPGKCCLACYEGMNCEHEGRYYYHGQIVVGVSKHECEECRCNNGNIRCDPVKCPATKCDFPVLPPGECCAGCYYGKYQLCTTKLA